MSEEEKLKKRLEKFGPVSESNDNRYRDRKHSSQKKSRESSRDNCYKNHNDQADKSYKRRYSKDRSYSRSDDSEERRYRKKYHYSDRIRESYNKRDYRDYRERSREDDSKKGRRKEDYHDSRDKYYSRNHNRTQPREKENQRFWSDNNQTKISNFSKNTEAQPKKKKYVKTPEERAQSRIWEMNRLLNPNDVQLAKYLDVGCGDGQITAYIGDSYKIREIYGCDIFTKEEAKNILKSEKLNYQQVQQNKFPEILDQSMDLVTCFVCIHHFEQIDEMFKEIMRILKPGGYLYIREHDVPRNDEKLKQFLDDVHKEYNDHSNNPFEYWPKGELKTKLEGYNLEYQGEYVYEGKTHKQYITHYSKKTSNSMFY